MKVSVLASPKPGYNLAIDEALLFGGHAAGICYMPDNFQVILGEPVEKTVKRANGAVASGHHSVFDHTSYTLLLEGVSKFLAMVLNNEKAYATSEKSARYTQMKPTPREQVIYDKWIGILEGRIAERYPDLTETQVHKLAQENARYMISVFTPTTMAHTASLRQWNYVVHWCERLLDQPTPNEFVEQLKPYVVEFLDAIAFLRVEGLNDEAKNRDLSIFDTRNSRNEYFGEVYCTTYLGSFAQLAQTHRHRTIDYKMRLPEVATYYVPPILADDDVLVSQWQSDIATVADHFPQGMLVSITERGTYENFILKTKERLCSSAQLEVSRRTWATLQRYLDFVKTSDPELFAILSRYNSPARCGSGFKCPKPCKWGRRQLDRLV